jgi:hypothetical protein
VVVELEFDNVNPPPDIDEEDIKKENAPESILKSETIQAKINSKPGIR